ncbi:hypothetical protein S40285_08272 [Stachybotrys chlorohalonatus IBT 40285]|uniref:Uncharacterized protein n=1 Tax=Stachybotrys chlorohalonatus (strain IBT 40285) TaxID=1283841 RepID=A0A084Q907_STAC4|nr:hypothetical protein S40285_08272 [Stachybotrys chlorohalonata IBT 40285]
MASYEPVLGSKSGLVNMAQSSQTSVEPRNTQDTQRREWRATFFSRLPVGELLAIACVAALSGSSVAILRASDGVPVNDWDVSPAVYLSILTTAIGVLLRFAFRRGATIAWWNQALDKSTLTDLHDTFNDRESLLSALRRDPRKWTFVRFASIFVTLIMANGPLLQQASYVDLTEELSYPQATLPIRSQPLANLTTIPTAATSIYQTEFTDIINQYYNRNPITLEPGICEGICNTTVVVGGFDRRCLTRRVDTTTMNLTEGATMFYINPAISSMNESHSLSIDVYYRSTSADIDEDGLNEIARLGGDASRVNSLTWHSCNLTHAYRALNITIQNTTLELDPTMNPLDNHTVEILSRSDLEWNGPYGFGVMLIDNFVSSVAWVISREGDDSTGAPEFTGQTARTYIDRGILSNSSDSAFDRSILTWRDPMPDILRAVDDLSLRYAAVRIPGTPRRALEYLEWVDDNPETQAYIDSVSRGQNQTVQLTQMVQVAVYAFRPLTLWLSVAFTMAAVVGVGATMRGFWHLGRRVSLSPIEVGKAFRAPLFAGVGSNMPARDIVEQAGDFRVQYGVLSSADSHRGLELAIDAESSVMGPKRGEWYD